MMRMLIALLLLLGLGITSCGEPERPAPRTATLVLSAPGERPAASAGGVIVIIATHETLPDLEVKLPIPENATIEAVTGALTFLAPKVWSERMVVTGNRVSLGEVTSAHVDAGSTGLTAEFTFDNP